MSVAMPNEARVVGQSVQRLKPCHRCGTLDGVTLTWAVPLDAGGEETDWNLNALCGPCRTRRVEEQESGRSDLYDPGVFVPEPVDGKRGPKRGTYEVAGHVFEGLSSAADFFGVSRATITNWVNMGHRKSRKLR